MRKVMSSTDDRKELRKILSCLVLMSSISGLFSQEKYTYSDVVGAYSFPQAKRIGWFAGYSIEFHGDSSFKYEAWSDAGGGHLIEGKWRLIGDTVILNTPQKPSILSFGEEEEPNIEGSQIALKGRNGWSLFTRNTSLNAFSSPGHEITINGREPKGSDDFIEARDPGYKEEWNNLTLYWQSPIRFRDSIVIQIRSRAVAGFREAKVCQQIKNPLANKFFAVLDLGTEKSSMGFFDNHNCIFRGDSIQVYSPNKKYGYDEFLIKQKRDN